MAKESFVITYPKSDAEKKRWSKEVGLNNYYANNIHWAKRREQAQQWHNLVRTQMQKQGIRKRPFDNPVVVRFEFNDRLDLDNHAIFVKLIIDGMKGRLIKDDTRRDVRGIEMFYHDEPYIKVTVFEVGVCE